MTLLFKKSTRQERKLRRAVTLTDAYRRRRASRSHSIREMTSPSRMGPLTFLMMERLGSSRNSTRTCVTLPVWPVRARVSHTVIRITYYSILANRRKGWSWFCHARGPPKRERSIKPLPYPVMSSETPPEASRGALPCCQSRPSLTHGSWARPIFLARASHSADNCSSKMCLRSHFPME